MSMSAHSIGLLVGTALDAYNSKILAVKVVSDVASLGLAESLRLVEVVMADRSRGGGSENFD